MARNRKLWLYILLILIPIAYFAWRQAGRRSSPPAEQVAQPETGEQPGKEIPIPEPTYMPVGEAALATSTEYLVSGKITDETGEALPGAAVAISPSSPRWSPPAFEQPSPLETAICDEEGRYQFRLKAAANLWVSIRKDGYAQINAFLPARDPKAVTRDYQLRPAQAGVVGFVFDKQDQPIAGALLVVNTPPFAPVAENPILSPTARFTDSSGKYAIEGLPDGDVSISVSARGFAAEEALNTVKAGQSPQIDFHLSQAAAISFPVRNSRGEALPYATATAPGHFKIAGGEKRGVIEISVPLELSPFDCTVAADGYKPNTILLDPKAPPSAVVLEDRPLFKGKVTAEKGEAVADALVSVWGTGGAQGKFDGAVTTDKTGRFSIPLAYPPAREVKVTKLGFFDQRLTFDSAKPAPPEPAIRMKHVESGIYGRVIDYRGISVKRFVVHLRDAAARPGSHEYQRSFSDERGAFMVTDIAPGTYTLIIQSIMDATTDNVQLVSREQVEIRKGFLLGEILMQFPPPKFAK
jgi:hypothetical protein